MRSRANADPPKRERAATPVSGILPSPATSAKAVGVTVELSGDAVADGDGLSEEVGVPHVLGEGLGDGLGVGVLVGVGLGGRLSGVSTVAAGVGRGLALEAILPKPTLGNIRS